jgi:hypothetical protein
MLRKKILKHHIKMMKYILLSKGMEKSRLMAMTLNSNQDIVFLSLNTPPINFIAILWR